VTHEAKTMSATAIERADATYILGSSATEHDRLRRQAEILAPLTRRFFLDAGLAPGMRVLDVGCGMGDVSLLAAEIVGPTGEVVGIDRDPAVLVAARERFAAGIDNVCFLRADFRALAGYAAFDAVVGRFVLVYQADSVAALRAVLPQVRPGGIVAFHEWDAAQGLVAGSPSPLFARAAGWVRAAFETSGANLRAGIDLYPAFLAAGLPAPAMCAEAVIGGPETGAHEMLAGWIRSVLPAIEEFGIATAAEVEIDTLADRLRAEAVANGCCVASPLLVGASARKP
jgi:SAM-dependent methyltransferase